MERKVKNISDMNREFKALRSYWSRESLLNTQMLLWLCEHFASKKNRKQSEWNRFFAKAVRNGKTAQQAAKEWKARRA